MGTISKMTSSFGEPICEWGEQMIFHHGVHSLSSVNSPFVHIRGRECARRKGKIY